MDKVIFDKKNVLIIGGAGFIGSHLCDELIKTSKVICLDNFSTGDEKNIDHLLAEPDFEFIKHDITSPLDLEKLPELQKFKIQFQGIQEIYNLACPFSIKNFEKLAIQMILANSLGLKNVLEIAYKYKAKVLHFSSAGVYGPVKDRQKVNENFNGIVDFLGSQSSYYEGRRFAESLIQNYKKQFDLDARIIRVFNVYGPRMSLIDGQLIPEMIISALSNKEIIINGDENTSLSFCFIQDIIDASQRIMNSIHNGPYNIGSDMEIKLIDLAKFIIKESGSHSVIKLSDKEMFETSVPLADISKARNDLGWMPIITMDKGLDKTIYELRARIGLKGVSVLKK